MKATFENYTTAMQQIADIKYAAAVLQWDQETYLPKGSYAERARQIATLTELAHEKFTDPRIGEMLQELLQVPDLSAEQRRNVELSWEDFQKSRRLPAEFVRRLSETINNSYQAWLQARRENSFAVFEQPVAEIIALKKQEAAFLGFEKHPYDALLNDYDKGLDTATVDPLFAALRPKLKALIDETAAGAQPDDSFLRAHFPQSEQWNYGLQILKQIGYDFDHGRQDISEHPFTTNFSSRDVRVTTRVDEKDFGNMLWSCIHEGGHALYEQGLPANEYGLPLGEFCSLSIHESQSRLWENNIGRGEAFWKYNFSGLQTAFPEQFGKVSLKQFVRGINKVQPSLIRTEADELTYHFHVMIRYELEKALIEGSLSAKEIPTAWNDLYKKYLGIDVPDDRRGCLQDVHWSHGSFGYFATYSIGSLYAAQFFAAIKKATPAVETQIAAGDFSSVAAWLRDNIYPYGRRYDSNSLCEKATGSPLNADFFLDYAIEKYRGLARL